MSKWHLLRHIRTAFLTGGLLLLLCHASAQNVADSLEQAVTFKEWNINIEINTSGAGVWFQHGLTPDYYNKHFWEIGVVYNRHPKTVRVKNNYYSGATSYCYGKMCDLFFLRGGYGYQRTLHHKPYWGGVSIRFSLSAGLSLGLVFPTYLRVVDWYGLVTTERYDPEIHSIDDILGRAPFWTNLAHISYPRPGFYGKMGFTFDFAKGPMKINTLEIGMTVDMIFPYVQQYAYNKAKSVYLAAYLSYNFGRRLGRFE